MNATRRRMDPDVHFRTGRIAVHHLTAVLGGRRVPPQLARRLLDAVVRAFSGQLMSGINVPAKQLLH